MPRKSQPRSREAIARDVDLWNANHPVGTPVLYFAVPGDGSTARRTTTRSRAFIADGVGVIYLKGVQCWSVPLAGVLGRRITYRQLCAIDDAGFMGKV
jgi:hypothetical protein